jgi:hypothetical protein
MTNAEKVKEFMEAFGQFKPKLGRYGYNHIAFCKK